MNQQQVSPDDGIEDDLVRVFHRARDAARRARHSRMLASSRGSRARHSRQTATVGHQSQADMRNEALARLVAALETRRYVHQQEQQQAPDTARTAEEIRRAAAERDAPVRQTPSKSVADIHVNAYRDRVLQLGVPVAVVDRLIAGYDAEAAQADARAATENAQASQAENAAAYEREGGAALAGDATDIDRAAAAYTDEAMNRMDDLRQSTDPTASELITEAGTYGEHQAPDGTTVEDSRLQPGNFAEVINLDSVQALNTDRDEGVEL